MLHRLVQWLQQMKPLSRGNLCHQRPSAAACWRPVRLGWAGTAGQGCGTIRQCHSLRGCRAAVPAAECPSDPSPAAPAPAVGRGRERALGAGAAAGKGQQLLGAPADSRVKRLA